MKVKKYLMIFLILVVPLIYKLSCNGSGNPNINNQITFNNQLSFYHIFKGRMSELNPGIDVELLEISSTLFTDHAEKQRLIRLPAGKKMILDGNGLPVFPEGTLLAKTFYYKSGEGKGKQVIETRLLLLANSRWNVATYKWNQAQTEAFKVEDRIEVDVQMMKADGNIRRIGYQIPSKNDCISCHQSNKLILPIGPKAYNLNKTVEREGKKVNQLAYLMEKGLIKRAEISQIDTMPDYQDNKLPIKQRARAYMDINCAHCHHSGGNAGYTTINLDYTTSLDLSGIKINKNNILIRMNTLGDYHMPKLGTTVVDDKGFELIKTYILTMK